MSIIYSIKQKLYQIEDGLHSDQRKNAKLIIKSLKQDQRELVLQILQSPEKQFQAQELKNLDIALQKPVYVRTKNVFTKISRAWKNIRHDRISSKKLINEIQKSKIQCFSELNKAD